jgi:hypothetical protein
MQDFGARQGAANPAQKRHNATDAKFIGHKTHNSFAVAFLPAIFQSY